MKERGVTYTQLGPKKRAVCGKGLRGRTESEGEKERDDQEGEKTNLTKQIRPVPRGVASKTKGSVVAEGKGRKNIRENCGYISVEKTWVREKTTLGNGWWITLQQKKKWSGGEPEQAELKKDK